MINYSKKLITADIGVNTTEEIIDKVRKRVKKEGYEDGEYVYKLLKEEIHDILIKSPSSQNDSIYQIDDNDKPKVIMVIGVNGVGKTTTIGKLAYNYKKAGKEVLIGAADTFRAAANEQLEIWAERAGVGIIQQLQGADPAAVAFDTLKSAISNKKDVVIIDNGRYQLAMISYAGWDKIYDVDTKDVHPQSEYSRVVNVSGKLDAGKERTYITLMLWKQSGQKWKDNELVPIDKIIGNAESLKIFFKSKGMKNLIY